MERLLVAGVSRIVGIFDPEAPSINVAHDNPGGGENFTISSDETSAFVERNGERLAIDEVSRLILEPVFFRDKSRRYPIERPFSPVLDDGSEG